MYIGALVLCFRCIMKMTLLTAMVSFAKYLLIFIVNIITESYLIELLTNLIKTLKFMENSNANSCTNKLHVININKLHALCLLFQALR